MQTFWRVLIRALLAALGSALAIGLIVFSAVPYGGGGEEVRVAVCAILFLSGWAMLPAVRASAPMAIVSSVCWIVVAVYLRDFGEGRQRGELIAPWLVATFALIVCLVVSPPRYLRN